MRVIAGEAKGRRLVMPRGAATRAATDRIRETLFAILEPEIEGAAVLDLYAGAGTLGIEALSRGAAHATLVERDRTALVAIRRNLDATGFLQRAVVVASDVHAFLGSGSIGGPYDLVLCDPPFADVGGLSATLAHRALAASLAPRAAVVARALRKHPPLTPPAARVIRTRDLGEEVLLFLRYDAGRAQRGSDFAGRASRGRGPWEHSDPALSI